MKVSCCRIACARDGSKIFYLLEQREGNKNWSGQTNPIFHKRNYQKQNTVKLISVE